MRLATMMARLVSVGIDMDLFGDTATRPTCAPSGIPKRLENAADGFLAFWQAWPKGHPRKVDKQTCLNRWCKLACAEQKEKIVQMVQWLQTQPDWLKDQGAFIPMPATWLNRRPWDEWEPPAPRRDAVQETRAMLAERDKGTAPMPEAVRRYREQLKGRA